MILDSLTRYQIAHVPYLNHITIPVHVWSARAHTLSSIEQSHNPSYYYLIKWALRTSLIPTLDPAVWFLAPLWLHGSTNMGLHRVGLESSTGPHDRFDIEDGITLQSSVATWMAS